MLIIAVVAVATGAFGPIYLHSADQAVLNGALGSAPPGNVGLTLQPGAGDGSVRLMDAADRVPRAGGGRTWFGRDISTDETGVATFADGEKYSAGLMARSEVCAHLVMVAGRCVTQAGSVVMSARSAHELGVAVGQSIDLSVIRSSRTASLTIAGLYAPNPSSRYWWGINYFGFGTGAPGKPNLDEAFASFRTVNTIAPASLIDRMVQVPFQPGSLAVDDTDHLESLLSQYKAAASADDGVVVGTQLPQVLAAAANDEHTSTSIVLVIDFEMLLLTVFALYFVASRTAAERLPDVQLAVLRGYRPGGTLVVALLEPVVIVLTAVPAGLLIAWLVASAAAAALFGPGVGASLTLLACWRCTPRRRHRRWGRRAREQKTSRCCRSRRGIGEPASTLDVEDRRGCGRHRHCGRCLLRTRRGRRVGAVRHPFRSVVGICPRPSCLGRGHRGGSPPSRLAADSGSHHELPTERRLGTGHPARGPTTRIRVRDPVRDAVQCAGRVRHQRMGDQREKPLRARRHLPSAPRRPSRCRCTPASTFSAR